MDLEFHQLDLRYDALRTRHPRKERQLLASLAEHGQLLPVVVVAADAPFVLVDGYKRVRALQRLAHDTVRATLWAIEEAEAVVLEHVMRAGDPAGPLAQGWLLDALRARFGLSFDELGRRFDKTPSWVSRRLALVRALPEPIQVLVRAGRIAPHAAMKYLVPVARANRDACLTLADAIARAQLSTRQVGELYALWQTGTEDLRALLLTDPRLALRAQPTSMIASDHTQAMLQWWTVAGIACADLAVRRSTGAMLWHRDVAVDALPLAWARAENTQHADIYIRPARGHAWPLVFVDDVAVERAQAVAREVDALLVETSPAGGCHVWLRCDRVLTEHDRRRVQCWWVTRLDADPGSVSGEHLGRLAGFKNWKRGGCWVNVLTASADGCRWPVIDGLTAMPPPHTRSLRPTPRADAGRDTTPSGQDWAWVCARLEHGQYPDTIYRQLVNRARPRRGPDAERYATRTLERALRHVAQHHDVDRAHCRKR